MTLMLHAGAEPADYEGLRALTTPLPTNTHVPIPHFRPTLVDTGIRRGLRAYVDQSLRDKRMT